MNYTCFLKEIEQRIAHQMGSGYNVELQTMRKNNGVILDSIVIRKIDELVCPNIYLRRFYDMYLEGMSLEEVCQQIIIGYYESIPPMPTDPESFISPENIRENVVCRLINYEKNADLLARVPHRQFLDLALIYYIMVHCGESGEGAIMINKNILDYSELSEDEIDEAARQNTKKLLPADVIRLTDLLRELGEKAGAQSYEDINIEEESSEMPLYVLTNKERRFGAYYMTDVEVLSDISEKLDTDLYVLPSSVHECMVVPVVCWDEPQSLATMVYDINRTQVLDEEYLADTVYRFSRTSQSLAIAV